MKKQSEAVYEAISSTVEIDGKVELTQEQFEHVAQTIADGIIDGSIVFSETAQAKYDTDKKVFAYAKSLVKNNLKKDKKLNGNTKYTPANPGTGGKRDPQLKALGQLLKQIIAVDAEDERAELIKAEISKREEEIKASKVKEVKIDTSVLSPELLTALNI